MAAARGCRREDVGAAVVRWRRERSTHLRSKLRRLLIAIALTTGLASASSAQENATLYVVTYIEAVPSAAAEVAEILTAYAEASRSAAGNLEFEALQRIGRPNHFAMIEAWTDAAALERHGQSASAERFDADLTSLLYSPPDRRLERSLVKAPQAGDAGPDAVYVLTHVDVIPPSLEPVVEDLRVLAEASRSEPANLRFDVLVTERRNHMTIVELWRDADAQAAHLGESHNRRFRTDLLPAQGALYDERLYRGL
jgi:quinol monooxygenase YgiN